MKELYLGLDTSNYTTSAALCDKEGHILWNQKKLLPVKEGERGLRQSDAVFLHVKALSETAKGLADTLSEAEGVLQAIGTSVSPRDSEGSYMPCFLVGSGVGEMLSAAMQIPRFTFSHQAGHLMAAAYSACAGKMDELDALLQKPFLAFHVSGGTTDILYAKPDAERILTVERLGGTMDINAGQLIDRMGVKMGLSFPSGAAMDEMALAYTAQPPKRKIPKAPVTVRELTCNLSGLENKATALWDETAEPALISTYVLHAVAMTLLRLTEKLEEAYPGTPILYAGGVMSSRYIKTFLMPHGRFAEAKFSSDNAAGTALLCRARAGRNGGSDA